MSKVKLNGKLGHYGEREGESKGYRERWGQKKEMEGGEEDEKE